MRSTLDIIIAVKESQSVTEEELRLALVVMSNAQHFVRRELQQLIDAAEKGKDLAFRVHFAKETIESVFKAMKRDPAEWLGPANTPGTPEYERQMTMAKNVFKRATGIDL